MIRVDNISGIDLIYDRRDPTSYGTVSDPYAFPMTQALFDVLVKFIDLLDSIGWKDEISAVLSA